MSSFPQGRVPEGDGGVTRTTLLSLLHQSLCDLGKDVLGSVSRKRSRDGDVLINMLPSQVVDVLVAGLDVMYGVPGGTVVKAASLAASVLPSLDAHQRSLVSDAVAQAFVKCVNAGPEPDGLQTLLVFLTALRDIAKRYPELIPRLTSPALFTALRLAWGLYSTDVAVATGLVSFLRTCVKALSGSSVSRLGCIMDVVCAAVNAHFTVKHIVTDGLGYFRRLFSKCPGLLASFDESQAVDLGAQALCRFAHKPQMCNKAIKFLTTIGKTFPAGQPRENLHAMMCHSFEVYNVDRHWRTKTTEQLGLETVTEPAPSSRSHSPASSPCASQPCDPSLPPFRGLFSPSSVTGGSPLGVDWDTASDGNEESEEKTEVPAPKRVDLPVCFLSGRPVGGSSRAVEKKSKDWSPYWEQYCKVYSMVHERNVGARCGKMHHCRDGLAALIPTPGEPSEKLRKMRQVTCAFFREEVKKVLDPASTIPQPLSNYKNRKALTDYLKAVTGVSKAKLMPPKRALFPISGPTVIIPSQSGLSKFSGCSGSSPSFVPGSISVPVPRPVTVPVPRPVVVPGSVPISVPRPVTVPGSIPRPVSAFVPKVVFKVPDATSVVPVVPKASVQVTLPQREFDRISEPARVVPPTSSTVTVTVPSPPMLSRGPVTDVKPFRGPTVCLVLPFPASVHPSCKV